MPEKPVLVTSYSFKIPIVLYFHLSIGLFRSPSESWNAFLISPCELKILLISYFLTTSMSHMLKGTNYPVLIMQLYVRGGRRVILSDKTSIKMHVFTFQKRANHINTGAKTSNLIKKCRIYLPIIQPLAKDDPLHNIFHSQ